MKIAMSLLSGIRYGGMTYCTNFIPALAKIDTTNEYHIFLKRNHPLLQLVRQNNFIFHECSIGAYPPAFWFFWEQVVFPFILKKKKIDVLFTAKNLNVVFAPCKTIVAVQNMAPLCYMRYKDHWKLRIFLMLKRFLTHISVRKANKVIVVSQSNREYVEKFFPEIKEKLFLTRNGNPVSEEKVKVFANKERELFLLTASKFVSYANQLSLIEGYVLLCQRKKDIPPLWFAGDVLDPIYFEKVSRVIQENGLADKIKILGLIPHDRLIELYCRAFAFIFPSTLETCPMTLLEAMACKIPIATSKIGPMPEVCEDAAIYFEPYDKQDIANKIEMLLSDTHLRERLVQKSSERSRLFGWDKIAAEMLEVFSSVYHERGLPQTQKKGKRIAISMLSGINYGGATYFKQLLPVLAQKDSVNEYHIFVQKGNRLPKEIKQANFIFHECALPSQAAFIRFLWEQFILPLELKAKKIDIIFTAKNMNILLASCKRIISIRNMEPFCYKNYENNYWKLAIFSWLRNMFTKISIEKADMIIAVSNFTRDYLKTSFPQSYSKVRTIYHGNSVNSTAKKYAFKRNEPVFLLSASKFVNYANQLSMVEGYAILHKERKEIPPLWIAGGVYDPYYFESVKRFLKTEKIEEKIILLGLIPHERLVELYAKAFAFIFPSTLEACPQTLIEAMASGVPIATSNVNPMPEICTDAAIYFSPYDKNDIAHKIDRLLTDSQLREELRRKSYERCRFFKWEKTAAETVQAFESV